jgi:hypothetical protein
MAFPAGARADAELVVARGDSAKECPDEGEVRRFALAAMAPSLSPPTHAYHVSFDRSGGAYRAEIVDDTAGRTRRLEDTGAACGPLGQAVAVVVATMWSSEHDEVSPAPAPVPPPPPPRVDPAPVPPPVRSRDPRWVFGAGAAVAAAVVRPVAEALIADADLEFAHGSLSIGALWIPVQRIDVTPGSIDVELISGSLRGCAFLGNETRFGFCANVLAGVLRAEGSGYTTDVERTRPWVAIEPDVFIGRSLFSWVRVRASAGPIIPLHAEAFSVTGAGAAYATPVVGALTSLTLEMATP